jgi:hypothetical protein
MISAALGARKDSVVAALPLNLRAQGIAHLVGPLGIMRVGRRLELVIEDIQRISTLLLSLILTSRLPSFIQTLLR